MMRGLAVCALGLLAACSSATERSPILGVVGRFVPVVNAIPGVAAEPVAVPGFTPEEIGANPAAYVVLHAPLFGDPVPARLISQSVTGQTFQAQTGFTASYRDGLLVATRGLGEDLLASTAQGTREAIAAGGGTSVHVRDRIGDLDQIISEQFQCVVESAGVEDVPLPTGAVSAQKFTEVCRSNRLQFTNTYWMRGGEMIASAQFVSELATYLRRTSL